MSQRLLTPEEGLETSFQESEPSLEIWEKSAEKTADFRSLATRPFQKASLGIEGLFFKQGRTFIHSPGSSANLVSRKEQRDLFGRRHQFASEGTTLFHVIQGQRKTMEDRDNTSPKKKIMTSLPRNVKEAIVARSFAPSEYILFGLFDQHRRATTVHRWPTLSCEIPCVVH